jgi:hypothetical protein
MSLSFIKKVIGIEDYKSSMDRVFQLRLNVFELLQLKVVLLDFFLSVLSWLQMPLIDHRCRLIFLVKHLHDSIFLLLQFFRLLGVGIAYNILDWCRWSIFNAKYKFLCWKLNVEVFLTFFDMDAHVRSTTVFADILTQS